MANLKATTIDSAGGTNLSIDETGVDKNSGSTEVFDVKNSGAGVAKLRQDGVDVCIVGVEEIPVKAAAMKPQVTSGCSALAWAETTTNDVMLGYLEFADAVTSYAQFEIPMPKGWNAGVFKAAFEWYSPSVTGNAEWGIQAQCQGDGDTLDSAWGTEQVINDAVSSANTRRWSAQTPDITAAGTPQKSDTLTVRVYRKGNHANDTVNGGVIRLLSVKLFPVRDGQNDA